MLGGFKFYTFGEVRGEDVFIDKVLRYFSEYKKKYLKYKLKYNKLKNII